LFASSSQKVIVYYPPRLSFEMKLSVAALLMLPAMAAAFVPAQPRAFGSSSLSAKAAKSKEEDLELTKKVIAKFMGDEEDPPKKKEEEKEEAQKEE
jgi:hypothetical protein